MTFNANLLMEMLAGSSDGLLKGQDAIAGVNPVTQKSIASMSYAGLLQKLLGGGGKMTLDKDKFSLTGTPDLLVDGEKKAFPGARTAQGNVNAVSTPGGSPNMPTAPAQPNEGNFGANQFGFLQQLLNPQQPRSIV